MKHSKRKAPLGSSDLVLIKLHGIDLAAPISVVLGVRPKNAGQQYLCPGSKPVNRLRRATEAMAAGDLGVRVDIETGDEIQELAGSFNEMVAKLRASYDDLTRTNEELQKACKVKSDFLAIMSHELRTPLTAIIGFSEMLSEGIYGKLESDQKETLEEILHNAASLLDMINGILALTKIDSGKFRLEKASFDPAQTLARVSRTMTPIARKKGLEFRSEVPGMLPAVDGDEGKIQQALLNLLSNAAKFTPREGTVGLTARHFSSWDEIAGSVPDRSRPGSSSDAFRHGGLHIVVEDSGIGIDPENHDRIFDLFQQVDGSETRSYGGVGLGLALAREYVQMHGGCIWVESELGRGTRFSILLPCSKRG